ncbi:bridging integrator 3 [Lingula anatina]|uniref:Bridging integrator 3 n=1 Tax=Lingula anatina TaxID=7574 RepID=A0A1S3HDI6_LINAN|nr:bridging integrator 3 [Lingula anatina]|eukprot:XP_013383159.1 bridging integrator 3 [Lingula anatina]
MSWFNRFTTPRRSVLSISAEKDFEREKKKLEILDERSKKLYKDMKRCTEAAAALSKCESKMSQDLVASSLCQSEPDLLLLVEDWNAAVVRLDLLMQEMNTNAQKAVVEPMKKFNSVFPSVQSAIKKREQSLQEYNKCQSKVEKYQDRERTGPTVVKLENAKKALNAAKEEFEYLNSQLMEDMPRLYEGRMEYFRPCFQALIRSQVAYFTEAFKIYTELSLQFNKVTEVPPDEKYDTSLQQKLSEIKSLSIVADD